MHKFAKTKRSLFKTKRIKMTFKQAYIYHLFLHGCALFESFHHSFLFLFSSVWRLSLFQCYSFRIYNLYL